MYVCHQNKTINPPWLVWLDVASVQCWRNGKELLFKNLLTLRQLNHTNLLPQVTQVKQRWPHWYKRHASLLLCGRIMRIMTPPLYKYNNYCAILLQVSQCVIITHMGKISINDCYVRFSYPWCMLIMISSISMTISH